MRHEGMSSDNRPRTNLHPWHDGRILAKPYMITYLYRFGALVFRGVYHMVTMVFADGDVTSANDAIPYLNTPAANECCSNITIEIFADFHSATIEQLDIASITKSTSMKYEL